MYPISHKNIQQHNCFSIDKKKCAPNHYIRMISEESCDIEDWSNGFWKFS